MCPTAIGTTCIQLKKIIPVQNFIIREATLEDLSELLAFEQALINAERPFDPTLKKGEIHYYDIRQMILASIMWIVVNDNGFGSKPRLIICSEWCRNKLQTLTDQAFFIKSRNHNTQPQHWTIIWVTCLINQLILQICVRFFSLIKKPMRLLSDEWL